MIGVVYTIPRILQRKYGEDYEVMMTTFGESTGYKKGYLTWSDLVYRLILPTLCLAFFNIALFREVSASKSPHGPRVLAGQKFQEPTQATPCIFYNNEPSKNKHFQILLYSLARYSHKPRLKKNFWNLSPFWDNLSFLLWQT